MNEFPSIATKPKKRNASTPIVYVSLYFLLLAFFIYLHSISVPVEEKIQKVIGSIDFAFKGLEYPKTKSSASRLAGDELGLAVFHAKLKRVYETAIPLVKSRVNETGDQLQFIIPLSQLFEEDRDTLRDTRQELFAEVTQALIKRSGVVATDMEILINAGGGLPSEENIKDHLAIRRVHALVEAFLSKGAPARNVYVGIKPGAENKVYFKFYIRKSFDNQFTKIGDQ